MDLSKLSDEELIEVIEKNNEKMQNIINLDPSIVDRHNKGDLNQVFLENVEYCLEGFRRRIKVPNVSFMMALATILGYSAEDLKIEPGNRLTKLR